MNHVRRIVRIIAFGMVGVTIIILLAFLFAVNVPLNSYKTDIEQAAQAALNQKLTIKGPLKLKLGLNPSLLAEDIQLEYVASDSDLFVVHSDTFLARLKLIPLLKGNIHILNLDLKGLNVQVTSLAVPSNSPTKKPAKAKSNATSKKSTYVLREIRHFSFQDITLTYSAPERTSKIIFSEIRGTAGDNKAITLGLQGKINEQTLSAKFTGGSLNSLFLRPKTWPISSKLQLGSSSVALDCEISLAAEQAEIKNGSLSLQLPEKNDLETLLHKELPLFTPLNLKANFSYDAKTLNLMSLSGNVFGTEFQGVLNIDTSQQPLDLSGSLEIDRLDPSRFSAPPTDPPSLNDESSKKSSGDEATYPITAKLQLKLNKIVHKYVDMEGLVMQLELKKDSLFVAANAVYADIPVQGSIKIHKDSNNLQNLDIQLEGKDGSLGKLLSKFIDLPLEGTFTRGTLELSGKGSNLSDTWKNCEMDVTFHDTAAEYTLDTTAYNADVKMATYSFWKQDPVFFTATGSYLGKVLSLSCSRNPNGTPPNALEISGSGAGAIFHVKETGDAQQASCTFKFSGENIGDMSEWISVSAATSLPYSFQGTFSPKGKDPVDASGWKMQLHQAQVGQSKVSGQIQDGNPMQAKFHFTEIHPEELLTLFNNESSSLPEQKSNRSPNPSRQQTIFQNPLGLDVLPEKLSPSELNIQLSSDLIQLDGYKIENMDFTAQIRPDLLALPSLKFNFNETGYSGKAKLDASGETPIIQMTLSASDFELGHLLDDLNLTKNMKIHSGQTTLNIKTQGHRVIDLIKNADADIQLKDSVWTLRDLENEAKLPFRISTGFLEVKPEQNTRLTLIGDFVEQAIKIDVQTEKLVSLIIHEDKEHLAYELNSTIAETEIKLKGHIALPLDRSELEGYLSIGGKTLTTLNKVFALDLPPLKNYQLHGKLGLGEHSYRMEDFHVVTGKTDLAGDLEISTDGIRPLIKTRLTSDVFQINDFSTKNWSPVNNHQSAVRSNSGAEKQYRELLSPEILQLVDAEVSVKVGQMISGKDRLGSGSLLAKVKDGKLIINDLDLRIPKGQIKASMEYFPGARHSSARLTINARDIDYGVIARRLDSNTDTDGLLDLSCTLNSRFTSSQSFLSQASGSGTINLRPNNLRSGVFDFWSANLIFALLQTVDPENASRLNCLKGSLQMKNGIMHTEEMIMDTSIARVFIDGDIDFKNESLDLYMEPRSKKPRIFSLDTPIGVKGKFKDLQVNVSTLDIGGTIVSVPANFYLYPARFFLHRRMPKDGSDICTCEAKVETKLKPEPKSNRYLGRKRRYLRTR